MPRSEWISLREASRLLSVPFVTVRRLIDAGYLSHRSVPFAFPRVLRSDVERLAADSTFPAQEG
jgi:hypothetical protein